MPVPPRDDAWNILPPVTLPQERRLAHVGECSPFAAGLLERHPDWMPGLDDFRLPDPAVLAANIETSGLEPGLRRFRNREMLGIVWRDLCGLATLGRTFASLTRLAEVCLQAALDAQRAALVEKHGEPRAEDGSPQFLFVIGLGKFGGCELNLSSDIDLMFCYEHGGNCDGRRGLSNEQFFTRQARAVIASLSEMTEDGFCFRVDTRLRPFGDSGPLAPSVAAMEQYYQREGRDWERYALVKARPVAGDLAAGERLVEQLRPFVYRRYIDYSSVEALQEMHASVQEDARRRDRLDDIKRGPGGIREIEFLAQCFQILRGGREPALQTPALDEALERIGSLGLLEPHALTEIRNDYAYLRFLENRIQALHDQQTHRLPQGPDRERVARAMYEAGVQDLERSLARTRTRVSERFHGIFPQREAEAADRRWTERWRALRSDRQDGEPDRGPDAAHAGANEPGDPLQQFARRLERMALSQRAHQRLDRFMPGLLERLDRLALEPGRANRVLDLVLAVCRRSAYLVLLVQNPKALDRMLELFESSDWVADKVIRFPALLDELIDPLLGRHIPGPEDLARSVARVLETAQDTEAVLENLNYLKLATTLRIAVGQLQGGLDGERARAALSHVADAILGGVLAVADREIAARHGRFGGKHDSGMAIIGYGSLGACELGYDSDLDIVFLFDSPGSEAGGQPASQSDGARPLPPERYYARLAQRALSFLTVMTPSGRLYEVDTRLRPNGRAGSLVSSVSAFREYQLNEAWTWELQALTRARFVAGSGSVGAGFTRIRQEVLCRERDEDTLRQELMRMRQRMNREREGDPHVDVASSAKHRPGGLVDIEFVAQFGVLASAFTFPRVIQATGTLAQLGELAAIGWIRPQEAEQLTDAMRGLRNDRMLAVLQPGRCPTAADTAEAAAIAEARLAAGTRTAQAQ